MQETIYTTTMRIAVNHLRSLMRDLNHKELTVNVADPTSLDVWTGWATFEYDPWLGTEMVTDGIDLVEYPVMGSVYQVDIAESWGVTTVDLRLLSTAEGQGQQNHIVIRLIEGSDWVADDVEDDNPHRTTCNNLYKLLSGRFHKTRVDASWLSEELSEAENDGDHAIYGGP